MNRYFLVVTPGLEKLLYKEICEYIPRLQYSHAKAYFTTGGIELSLSQKESEEVIARSRLLESLRLRIARFHASQWYELENGVNHLPLLSLFGDISRYKFDLRVTSHKSRLYHTNAIQDRILNTRLMSQTSTDAPDSIPLYFFFHHDHCQVSIEIGGNYKRGYRKYLSETPLRETLAAAVCYSSLSSLSSDSSPLTIIDPFCGAGTILQEAMSYLENDIPLYQHQRYQHTSSQLDSWPSYSPLFPYITQYSLLGNDISLKAIEAAKKNFDRLIQFTPRGSYLVEQKSFQEYKKQISNLVQGKVMIISNPPYGYKSSAKKQSTLSLYHELCEWILEFKNNNQLASASILIPSFIYKDHVSSVFKNQCKNTYMTNNRGLPIHLVTL